MKKLIFIVVLTIAIQLSDEFCAFAQNVGIGTPTPAFKLDVRNGSINTDSAYWIRANRILSIRGTENTFVGVNTGSSISTGNRNVAVGDNALYYNTTGGYNTATGGFALYNNSTGVDNTSLGAVALYYNTTGGFNTATGAHALYFNTIGTQNTANGRSALYNNSTGVDNTAVGSGALYANSSGRDNAAVGVASLLNTPFSDGNTAIGSRAGYAHNNGYYNTYLGSEADADGDGYYNSVAIGNIATVTAPLQIRIGSSLMASIGGYKNWTNLSDGRYKQNIKEDVKGLEFIMKLRPVTYNLNVSAISEKLNESRGREMNQLARNAIIEKEKVVCTGFIAQEVEKVATEIGYDFSGIDKPKNANDFYGLRYAEFVVPLVKAVQEQQSLIEKMGKRIELLEEQNSKLQLLLNK